MNLTLQFYAMSAKKKQMSIGKNDGTNITQAYCERSNIEAILIYFIWLGISAILGIAKIVVKR